MTLSNWLRIFDRQRFRHLLALIVTSVMLVFLAVVPVVPVAAQTATPALPISISAPNRGDITPAGLLVAATAILSGILGGMVLIVIKVVDDRAKARDDAREEAQKIAEEKRQLETKEADAKRAREQAATENLTRVIDLLAQIVQSTADDRKEAAAQRALTTQHQEHTASTLKETAGLVSNIRTRQEAKDEAQAINQHTSSAVDALSSKVDDAVKSLNTAQDEIRKAANAISTASQPPTLTQIAAVITQQLDPLQEQITELIQQLVSAKRKGDTGRLNPAVVPETPPDAAQPNTNPN